MHTPLVVRLAPRSPGGDFMWQGGGQHHHRTAGATQRIGVGSAHPSLHSTLARHSYRRSLTRSSGRRAQKRCCIFARLSCDGRSPHCASKCTTKNCAPSHNHTLDTFLCHHSPVLHGPPTCPSPARRQPPHLGAEAICQWDPCMEKVRGKRTQCPDEESLVASRSRSRSAAVECTHCAPRLPARSAAEPRGPSLAR